MEAGGHVRRPEGGTLEVAFAPLWPGPRAAEQGPRGHRATRREEAPRALSPKGRQVEFRFAVRCPEAGKTGRHRPPWTPRDLPSGDPHPQPSDRCQRKGKGLPTQVMLSNLRPLRPWTTLWSQCHKAPAHGHKLGTRRGSVTTGGQCFTADGMLQK